MSQKGGNSHVQAAKCPLCRARRGYQYVIDRTIPPKERYA
jgi:hypothetical protein